MFQLKSLIAQTVQKTEAAKSDLGGKKWARRGEIDDVIAKKEDEKKKERPLTPRREERRRLKEEQTPVKEKIEDETETQILPKSDVVKKLRLLGKPASLFGETEEERFARMKEIQNKGEDHLDEFHDVAIKGSLLGRTGLEMSIRSRAKESRKRSRDQAFLDDGSIESGVYKYYSKLMEEWKKLVAEAPTDDKKKIAYRRDKHTCDQCEQHMIPLLKMVRQKTCPPDIINSLSEMASLCEEKEYNKANAIYLRLAIGNAPWPMGVTSIHIHDRAAHSKISTGNVAHVMNNEAQRKFITAVRTLVLFCQRVRPTDPSKMAL